MLTFYLFTVIGKGTRPGSLVLMAPNNRLRVKFMDCDSHDVARGGPDL